MHRGSYHITIIGKIAFLLPAEPEGQTRWVLAIALLTSRHRVEAVSRPSSALVSVAGRSASVPSARSSARRTFRSRCDLIRQGSREPPQIRLQTTGDRTRRSPWRWRFATEGSGIRCRRDDEIEAHQ